MSFDGNRGPPKIEGMTSLKVDNLTYRTTIEDLKRVFSKYGELGDIYIPRDRHSHESRGFAFIRFWEKRDAEDAMDSMDRNLLDGREVRVQMARYGRPTDPYRPKRSRASRYRSRSRSHSPRRRQSRYSKSRSKSPRRNRHSHSRSPRKHHSRSHSPAPRSRSRSHSGSRSRRQRSKSHSASRSPKPRNLHSRSRSPVHQSQSKSRSRSFSPQQSHSKSPRGRYNDVGNRSDYPDNNQDTLDNE